MIFYLFEVYNVHNFQNNEKNTNDKIKHSEETHPYFVFQSQSELSHKHLASIRLGCHRLRKI